MINSDQNTECFPTPAGLRLTDNHQILMNPTILVTQETTNILNDISGKQSQIIRMNNNEFYYLPGRRGIFENCACSFPEGFCPD